MILGDDGQKLSKRHGAVSVMQYDDELFAGSGVELIWRAWAGRMATTRCSAWSSSCSGSISTTSRHRPRSSIPRKLNWLNAHYLKQADPRRLAAEAGRRLARQSVTHSGMARMLRGLPRCT